MKVKTTSSERARRRTLSLFFLILALAVLLSLGIFDLRSLDSYVTSADEEPCYEIFTSAQLARLTFLLNKCTGESWVITHGQR